MPYEKDSLCRHLEEFRRALALSITPGDLWVPLKDVTSRLGFSWFALLRAGDVTFNPDIASVVTNYPPAWQAEILDHKLYIDDPAHSASSLAYGGVSWHDIEERVNLSDRQRATLKRACNHGLRSGFTLKLRTLGVQEFIFSTASEAHTPFHQDQVLSVRLIAAIIHGHVDRLFNAAISQHERVHLSPREIDCLKLVAQGKTDWEIAAILGVSHNTVHEYVDGARRRYGVRKRVQLVLRAIRDGHLNYP